MVACFANKNIVRLFFASAVFLLHVVQSGSTFYQCLIPFQYCMNSFMPIGYAVHNFDFPMAIEHLNDQCPTFDGMEQCTRRFQCTHEELRRRLEAFLGFFNWLCQNAHVMESNLQCWGPGFKQDILHCGQMHIAGAMGRHLDSRNHPCPYIEQMTICTREQMLRRPECSDLATEFYVNVISLSSMVFALC